METLGKASLTVVHLGDGLSRGSRAAAELHERVAATNSWERRRALVDAAFLGGLDDGPPAAPEVTEVWRRLIATRGRVSVAALAAEVGWSVRHLDNRFRTETGLTPKAAARVVRFDRARRLVAAPGANFADVAATSGYYDQAHLARDFREMAGCAPSRWLAEEAGG